ncbi:MAG: TfoX/Sxy family protein [Candidatus Eiseniibacteriota bacterium]
MAVSPDYLDHLLDQFTVFGAVDVRRMFGGVGLFRGGLMIALVTGDTLYFKVDDANRAEFEAAGMGPFTYGARGERVVMSYYEAPAEVFDDPEVLARWARSAHDAALRAGRGRGRAERKPKPGAKSKPKTKPKSKPKPKSKKPAAPKAKRPAGRRR